MTLLDLDTLHLDSGGHRNFEAGHCLMEAVAYFAGEPHTDQPQCVSPYLRSFGIRLNDRATDEQRQALVRFVPLVVGTAGDGKDEIRRWMAADHVARVSLPRWLDAAGLTARADRLRALVTIDSRDAWDQLARPLIRAARDEAYELRRDRRARIRTEVKAAVEKALAERAVAVAVAVAAAVAVAVAAAVAAAAAAAAAVADADDRYWAIRREVYNAVYAKARAAYGERFAPLIAQSWDDAVDLYGRLIAA